MISSRNGIHRKRAVETAEKRTLRLEARRRRYQLARAEETAEERKERLKKRNEKDRAKRAKERQERHDKKRAGLPALQQCRINVETADGREVTVFALPLFQHKSKVNTEKLPALQLHDSRIGLETESQRESRLQQQRAYHCSKMEEESELERIARLERANQLKHLRLPTETDKERDCRLEYASQLQRQKIAVESDEDRAIRLRHMSDLQRQKVAAESADHHFPLLEEQEVQDAMRSFHQEMASIQTPTCITCKEKFPGMQVNSHSECLRCYRDKHVPKLFSHANNMHPGQIPMELQVSHQAFHIKERIKLYGMILKLSDTFNKINGAGCRSLFKGP